MQPGDGPREGTRQQGDAPTGEWVTIARLMRTRGRRGELSAVSFSSHPERFAQLQRVALIGAEGYPGEIRTYEIEEIWEHGARLIFKFKGVDSISEAEKLRGAEVCVPAAERFPLPPDEYYQSDLVGCEVLERGTGRRVGRVADFLEAGGSGLLQVEGEGGEEILIPFTREICVRVDVERKQIEIDPPEGLLELNRE